MTDDFLKELASLPTFAHPTASPDGDRVALYYDETGRNELHVLDAETGDWATWSDGDVPRNARWWVRWAADGERVFYHKDEDGNEQNDVHAIDADGETEAVVEMAGQSVLNDVGADGETLLVGSAADGQMNLYVHDLPSGETRKITEYDRAVGEGLLSPDCDRVAYATNESDDYRNQDVYVSDVDGSDPRNLRIGAEGAEAHPVDWGPEGDRLLVADTTEDLSRAGVYDLRTDEVTWYGDGSYQEQPVQFLPDGSRFLATRTRDASDVALVYDTDTGSVRNLDLPEGVASYPDEGSAALDDDRVLVVHTTPTTRPELLLYDLSTDEYETLVEAEYGSIDPETFADAEFFTFASNGVADAPAEAVELEPSTELDIEALLYDSGERPSPLIVAPHGGPPVQDKRKFGLYTQFLVSRGYSVLRVNYRGSAGRGREFREELYDDWGGAEQADVARAVEHVLDTRDWIDDDTVAVFGGSYGGYSAYWQMVQYPSLYDAGVAWIGLTDLEDMYENTMPHFRTELMEKYLGTPEENPGLYEERSPVTHAENLAAPLLLLHGVNDRRVPVSQARIFRDALDDLGYEGGEDGDYEYVELGEEGHGSSDIQQKIRAFEILDDFLGRRLGDS
ncbi:prolyl oligopeptidase family serine peptidase [Halorussus sp. MSC15.2]|uniref:S9 family peptidase n=1 Tax=Halorussus sp. MSC15.2 TaxID=2283638 RepID=UPI0013D399F5|nr:prolyl oligopeptidase family serine peptidase [Halorussus sp. MSC15.2]NEU57086.1 S9 family peptidase [Halorussus sp. MSC15.2]